MADVVSITVYPREGTTYPDASGVPITAAGAIVFTSKYIRDAIRAGFLLTWDPLGVYLPEDRTGSGSGGGDALAFDTAAQLGVFLGTTAGQVAVTTGCLQRGDGGGGQWYWDPESSASANTGTVVGSSPAGRWIRLFSGRANVRWFGARGDGTTDDSAAFTSALLTCSDVFVPFGTFRLNSWVRVQSGQSLVGAGSYSVLEANSATSGERFALLVEDAVRTTISDLRIVCNPGCSGIKLRATLLGISMYNNFDRVQIRLASSGETLGWDITVADPSGGTCVYFPRFSDCDVEGFLAGANDTSYGLRLRGALGSGARSPGGRMHNCRFTNLHTGIDIDNTDTWVLDGCLFDGIYQQIPISTSGTGRAIRFGTNTTQMEVRAPRIEDVDVWIEDNGNANVISTANGPTPAQITGGSDLQVSGFGSKWSQDRSITLHSRPHAFFNTFQLGYYEQKTIAGGELLQALADNSGVISPMIRINGAASAFSIGSILLQPPTDVFATSGAIKYVYNSTSQSCTIVHESGGGAANERIATMTGTNIVVPGPAVMKFIYDSSVGGAGSQRWLYMGAS